MTMNMMDLNADITQLKRDWSARTVKFAEWYDILTLVDKYKKDKMESYSSNEPRTAFNMGMYLLTASKIRHTIPITGDNPVEFDKQSRVERGCQYMWQVIDRNRRLGGQDPFLWELGFYLLATGWYSMKIIWDKESLFPDVYIWSPAEVFPRFEEGRLTTFVHSYPQTVQTIKRKILVNGWKMPVSLQTQQVGTVTLDDYYYLTDAGYMNIILVNGEDVTGETLRDDMLALISPLAGFPDMGSLKAGQTDYQGLRGQSPLETNSRVWDAINRWKSFELQILRDTAEPKWQEFVQGESKLKPDKMRERGAVFSYGANDRGILAILAPPIPMELRAELMDMRKEAQKGMFSDVLYGIVEQGMTGSAMSQLTSTSASTVLYPYLTAKHFIISEIDRFWLGKLKNSKKVFNIKGRMIEKLKPTDIPDDVDIMVESELATPKDWMERATVANMLEKHLDETSILDEILHVQDTAQVTRRRNLDLVTKHPQSQMLLLIGSYRAHAEYLKATGDTQGSDTYMKAAQALEMQLGIPPAGSGKPANASMEEAARSAGASPARTPINPAIATDVTNQANALRKPTVPQ
jgi:hypothetical protein